MAYGDRGLGLWTLAAPGRAAGRGPGTVADADQDAGTVTHTHQDPCPDADPNASPHRDAAPPPDRSPDAHGHTDGDPCAHGGTYSDLYLVPHARSSQRDRDAISHAHGHPRACDSAVADGHACTYGEAHEHPVPEPYGYSVALAHSPAAGACGCGANGVSAPSGRPGAARCGRIRAGVVGLVAGHSRAADVRERGSGTSPAGRGSRSGRNLSGGKRSRRNAGGGRGPVGRALGAFCAAAPLGSVKRAPPRGGGG